MPIDQKRINGPEVSIPYSVYIDRSSKNSDLQKSLSGVKREDGRAHDELRKMCKIFFIFYVLQLCQFFFIYHIYSCEKTLFMG